MEQTISEAIASLHGHWYGRAPAGAKTYIMDDVVVTVLEQTFTPAEQLMIERDKASALRDIRRVFEHELLSEEFEAVVEQETGRKVRAFISDTHLSENLSIQVFILGDAREDMAAFETGAEKVSA